MSEHVHMECARFVDGKRFMVKTVVRRRYAEREEAIYREIGYDIEQRYCGDPVCLAPELPSKLAP